MSIEQAASTVDTWFEQPNVRFLPDTNATLRRSLDLLRELGVAGNLTTDAQIAAHALEHSGTVATNDADFSRFAGVKTLNPLLGPA
ncbi:MAG: PIN domain-containing protein [Tessaracoccus sp.]|uniref:PIN domain-containing protein n=1 Tax=Tessaracoccus sp. TaxID=1971211 RepID=UPI001ED784A4|nr:PIN domain-containing protein [Tessaracoccus sp.]MBK7822178.1 PIN domain-containing protein [Tessaracoccus sp.]